MLLFIISLYFKKSKIKLKQTKYKKIVDLTVFDYIVLSIMLFFTFVGLVRGFIRELASLINWVGSGVLTVLLRPLINDLVSHKISNPVVSNIVSSVLIFLIAIIGLSILTSSIAKAINTKFPTSINITLGIAFGFTKGFLICSLIFASIITLFGNSEEMSSKSGPKWLQESETYRPLSFGAYMILPFADSILGQIKEKYSPENEDKESDEKEEKSKDDSKYLRRYEKLKTIDDLIDKTEKNEEKKTEKNDEKKTENSENENADENGGYKKDQVDKLKHLIDII